VGTNGDDTVERQSSVKGESGGEVDWKDWKGCIAFSNVVNVVM
jgi:hypothetical protein